jgi:hypothetical protein
MEGRVLYVRYPYEIVHTNGELGSTPDGKLFNYVVINRKTKAQEGFFLDMVGAIVHCNYLVASLSALLNIPYDDNDLVEYFVDDWSISTS